MMTMAQLEERVSSLGKRLEQLQDRLNRSSDVASATIAESSFPGEDEIIPGAEYPVVLSAPPTKVIHLRGVVRQILPARQDLGLSDADIALFTEAEDE